MLTQAQFAQRLKKMREDRGYSQQWVSDALGIPRTAIVQIEKGDRSVSTVELAKLADTYRLPISSFFESESVYSAQEHSAPEQSNIFALLRGSIPVDSIEVKKEIDAHLRICDLGAELEGYLGLSRKVALPCYEGPAMSNKAEAAAQGAAIADEERRRLNLGDAPLLNLVDLISNQGIWLAGVRFPDTISGMIVRTKEIGTVILVGSRQGIERRRFSLAHEYAHALIDHQESNRISTAENRSHLTEARANGFAAAFLMPESGVRQFLRQRGKGSQIREQGAIFDEFPGGAIETDYRRASGSQAISIEDAVHLARYFGVSYPSAVYRLNALGVIDKTERVELLSEQAEASRKGYQDLLKIADGEPNASSSREEEPLIMKVAYLAIECFRREKISEGKIGEIAKDLSLSKPKFLKIARDAAFFQTEEKAFTA